MAECESASCAENFRGIDYLCYNFGSEQNSFGNKTDHNSQCPFHQDDRAVCDVSDYVAINGGLNCRGTAAGGGGQCAGAHPDFRQGMTCFYTGNSEEWKVCALRSARNLLQSVESFEDSQEQPREISARFVTIETFLRQSNKPSRRNPATRTLTLAPSVDSTLRPTQRPRPTTLAPSASSRPTALPTLLPTRRSRPSTLAPVTSYPSTLLPSIRPTRHLRPTSLAPCTSYPTTRKPTTTNPTLLPTMQPSVQPTQPTQQPSSTPTTAPSRKLTRVPTRRPTQRLTLEPTWPIRQPTRKTRPAYGRRPTHFRGGWPTYNHGGGRPSYYAGH